MKSNEKNKKDPKKILLTGGGTGGSVSPLLALAKELPRSDNGYSFLWVGTKNGVEKNMVKREGMDFYSIPAGKLRRYFDWKNFIDPFKILFGFLISFFLLIKWRPALIMTAGSFVSVPVVWAGWLWRVPIIVHQQDVRPGLANKLMAPFATRVTVTFQQSLEDYGKKAIWTGNPVSATTSGKEPQLPDLEQGIPVVLVVGGGTGSAALNELVRKAKGNILKDHQLIHITGENKEVKQRLTATEQKRYHSYPFLEHPDMLEVIKRADVVVSRSGLGVLTEISKFGKPSILIPIPRSHQEDNARLFQEKEAAVVLDQERITAQEWVGKIRELIKDKGLRDRLCQNVQGIIRRDGNENTVKIVKELID